MTDYVIQQIVNALSAGSLYALMAVGLAMVFGILRLINFAHGDVMMIAAYIAVFALGAGLPLEAALTIMVVGTVIVGLLMERIAYRPLRGGPEVAMLLSSFAVGQILQNGTLLTTRLAGKPTLIAFPAPEQLSGVIMLGSITVAKVNVVSFVAGVVLLGLLTLFVTRTTLGLSMRAAAEDLDAARLMGIKVNRVVATAFAISAGLAAVAGFLYAVQAGQINPYMGFTPVLKAFIAAVIGGFGSIAGAVLGGYVLGFLEVLVTALAGIGDLLPAGSVPPEVRGFLQQVAAELAGELSRRGRVHRPHPRPPRPAAGHPRPARRRRPGMTARRAAGPLLVILLSSVALAVLDASGQAFWQGLVINLGLFIILTVSLNLTSGFTGVFSLGQIGFMALGAYASAILTLPLQEKAAYLPNLPSWIAGVHFDEVVGPVPVGFLAATLIAAVLVSAIAWLVGRVLMRLSGHFVAVATLGFLVIVRVVLFNADAFTRGSRTFSNVTPYTNLWWTAVWTLGTVYVVWRIKRSSYGRDMFAQREDRVAAQSVGIRVMDPRLLAFVVGAFFSAVAGSLYAHFITSFSPTVFYFDLTFRVITMLVIGGMGSVSGSIIGAILIVGLGEALRRVEDVTLLYGLSSIVLAVIFIVVIIVRPSGLLGQREVPLDRLFDRHWWRRRSGPTPDATAEGDQSP